MKVGEESPPRCRASFLGEKDYPPNEGLPSNGKLGLGGLGALPRAHSKGYQCRLGPEVQPTRRPANLQIGGQADKRTSRQADQRIGGPAYWRTSKPAGNRDRRTGGPADQRTSRSADQLTKTPADLLEAKNSNQKTSCEKNRFDLAKGVFKVANM